jgi:hypothetical protein
VAVAVAVPVPVPDAESHTKARPLAAHTSWSGTRHAVPALGLLRQAVIPPSAASTTIAPAVAIARAAAPAAVAVEVNRTRSRCP